MSVIYPVPVPVAAKIVARQPLPFADKTIFLQAAPAPDVQLPSLITAQMMPPQGSRL